MIIGGNLKEHYLFCCESTESKSPMEDQEYEDSRPNFAGKWGSRIKTTNWRMNNVSTEWADQISEVTLGMNTQNTQLLGVHQQSYFFESVYHILSGLRAKNARI